MSINLSYMYNPVYNPALIEHCGVVVGCFTFRFLLVHMFCFALCIAHYSGGLSILCGCTITFQLYVDINIVSLFCSSIYININSFMYICLAFFLSHIIQLALFQIKVQ